MSMTTRIGVGGDAAAADVRRRLQGEKRDLSGRDPDAVKRLKSLYHSFPTVSLDRTRKAREAREKLAQPPQKR